MDESWDKRFANRGVIPIDLKVIDDNPVMNACGDAGSVVLIISDARWIKTKLMSMR